MKFLIWPDCGGGRCLRCVEWLSVIRGIVGDPADASVTPDADCVALGAQGVIINVIQTKVERLEVAIILRVVLEATLGRSVQSAAGNPINPNLPGPGKSGPLNIQ